MVGKGKRGDSKGKRGGRIVDMGRVIGKGRAVCLSIFKWPIVF